MVDKNVTEELARTVRKFYKTHPEMTPGDMSDCMKMLYGYYNDMNRGHGGLQAVELSGDAHDKINSFWHSLVQQTIDFINSNPEIKQSLLSAQEDLMSEWNAGKADEDKMKSIIPDIGVHFGIDGLESSLESGEWCPVSDSYITFMVGNKQVISKY